MWIMDSDGDNAYLVASEPSGYEAGTVHVSSPDGARIAVNDVNGGEGIALMNPDGTNKQIIPNKSGFRSGTGWACSCHGEKRFSCRPATTRLDSRLPPRPCAPVPSELIAHKPSL
jgi:hypothetical protein